MQEISTYLKENFYNNVSHNDTLMKMNLLLQDIIKKCKKERYTSDAVIECSTDIDSFEKGYVIVIKDKRGTLLYTYSLERPKTERCPWLRTVYKEASITKKGYTEWTYPSDVTRFIWYSVQQTDNTYKVVKVEDLGK